MLKLPNSTLGADHTEVLNKFLDNNARLDERLNALEGNFSNLTKNINSQFQSLTAKFEERSKPRYELIGVGVTIISLMFSALWVLAFNPINATLGKLEANFDKINTTAVTQQELDSVRLTIEAKFKSEREILDLWQKYSTLNNDVNKANIDRLLNEALPRKEYDIKHQVLQNAMESIQLELHAKPH